MLKRKIIAGVGSLAEKYGYSLTPEWRMGRLPMARHLRQLFDKYAVDCVLDVGGNMGQYRDMLREEAGYSGRIISFEPVKKYAESLRERSRSDPGWIVFDFALGSKDESAEINVTQSPGLNSFLAPRKDVVAGFWKEDAIIGAELVRTKRLDGIYRELVEQYRFGRPYLKLDTQGFEMEILKGAAASMGSMCGLQIEASIRPIYQGMPEYQAMIDYLGGLGFSISGLFPVTHDAALRMIEFDCLMVNQRFAELL